ncbi:MAG: Nif3-like dinuclear metal center hexameric protein [Bacteroidales bacterium]
MPLLKEIAYCLEELAPLSHQESYDNSGLQLGQPDLPINSALVTLDLNEQVTEEAIRLGVDLIVTHHPLIFKPLKQITGATPAERIVHRCIRENIAVYACHTNLDASPNGVSRYLAQKLGITNGSILEPRQELLSALPLLSAPYQAGFGWIGNLPEPLQATRFLEQLKEKLQCGAIRYNTPPSRPVQKVALCGGSGSDLLELAIAAGADAYITADLKYHAFQAAEGALLLVDAGHYETEQFTKELFYDVLTKKFNNFAVHISTIKTNPINYL